MSTSSSATKINQDAVGHRYGGEHHRLSLSTGWGNGSTLAADEPLIVGHCYEEILGRMQANLDEMAAAVPHPVMARVRDPFRHGSLARADRA